jgi:hypothetical protein
VTVLVHSGFITWHYWYPRVRQAEVFDRGKTPRDAKTFGPSPRDRTKNVDEEEKGDDRSQKYRLPCRLKVHAEGVQAFLYNRSPAYDNILNSIHRSLNGDDEEGVVRPEDDPAAQRTDTSSPTIEKTEDGKKFSFKWSHWFGTSSSKEEKPPSTPDYAKPEVPSYLRIMPIQIVLKTGAVVLGNENTKSIITVKFDTVSGSIDADEAGPFDTFKIMFSFDIRQPYITMRPNMDFKEMLLSAAVRIKNSMTDETAQPVKRRRRFWPKFRFTSFLHSSANSVKTSSVTDLNGTASPNFHGNLPGEERWLGLSRYVDDNFRNEHDEWDGVEYARSSVIADCPRLGFAFYWDVAGKTPEASVFADEKLPRDIDHVNGSPPPEYGMDLLVYGGTISYGPWTDRQRVNFQNIFFPPIFANAVPGTRLKAGEYRVSTQFKLYLSIEEETTLRIPVREQSKDWKWKGRADAMTGRRDGNTKQDKSSRTKGKRRQFWKTSDKTTAGPNARPFAWLDVKVAKDSTVNYVMDMVARKSGFKSNVNADIPRLEIYTSVNHGLLWRSGRTKVDCDLSVPLGFNTLRQWRFNVENDGLELFILRDHLFLLVDLVGDWTSGPPSEFHTFTPFKYHLDVQMRNFKLYLNANDSNIINDPANLDENHFIILNGRHLHAKVDIPLDQLNPKHKEVPFHVVGRDFGLQLCLNTRNTVASFVGKKDVAILEDVTLSGSFVSNSESSTQLTDRLTFNIHGSKLTLWLFGFVVHHLVTLKENYFGEHLHFKTLEEYQDIASGRQVDSDQIAKMQGANRSNDLDIVMSLSADDIRALLPANIYKSTESIVLDVSYVSADLRLTSYYLDLQLNSSPLCVSLDLAKSTKSSPLILDNRTEVFVQCVEVSGHRTFGLPPSEPSYYSHWDLSVGDISGECSSSFIEKLLHATLAFTVTIHDEENSLSLIELAPVHDITFLHAKTKTVKVWVRLDQAAILVAAEPATVEYNDWAGPDFSQRLNVKCSQISVSMVDANSIPRNSSTQDPSPSIITHAHLATSLNMSMLRRKLHFAEEREKQQEYLMLHDSRTHRVPFLRNMRSVRNSQLLSKDDPPAMSYPPVPEPITLDANWLNQRTSLLSSHNTESFNNSCTSSLRATGFQAKLPRKPSHASLSASIRSKPSQPSLNRRFTEPQGPGQRVDRNINTASGSSRTSRRQPGQAPSSLALSSPLATPYFPLLTFEPDESDLPPLLAEGSNEPKEKLVVRRESTTFSVSEDQTHTSIIVSTGAGVQCFVKPGALSAILELLNLTQPKTPDDLLDSLQISMWSTISTQEKKIHGTGQILELRLDVPNIALRFLNPFELENSKHAPGCDQFDLAFTNFSLMGRHSTPGATSDTVESASMHCSLGSLAIVAAEKSSLQGHGKVALELRLDDFLTWLAFAESQVIHLSFRDLNVSAETLQVEWLTSMVRRVTKLGRDMFKQANSMQISRRHRFAYLAYALTTEAEHTTVDAPFIIRPSYLLRAASGHVRNHDSWKIVSRSRYIYEKMSPQAREKLVAESISASGMLPENAEVVVINSWNHWRTWDLSDVQQSSAMKFLFSRDDAPPIPAASVEKNLQVGIRAGGIRFAIDPGEKQTDFDLQGLAVNLVVSPPSTPDGLMLVKPDIPTRRSVLQLNAQGVYFNLNWAIIPATENVLAVLRSMIPAAPKSRQSPEVVLPRRRESPVALIAQGVLTINETVLRVITPNLQGKFSNNGTNVSIVGSSHPTGEQSQFVSVLVHAGEGRSEFTSIDRTLLVTKAQSPTLYLSRTAPGLKEASREIEWRLAASSSHISLDVESEILDMIEVVDHFIGTEFADAVPRIKRLIGPPGQRVQPEDYLSNGLPKLNLALLMDSYSIRVALLQAITYTMEGKQGRISILPRLIQQVSLDLNFDLDGHVHRLVTTEDGTEHVISSIHLPPVNGQLGVRRMTNRVLLNVRAIIEQIDLDASAVHALLSTFKRPEVSKTFSAIQADVRTVQDRIQSILPQSPVTRPANGSGKTELVYNVSATLTGVRIIAQAPGKLQNSGIATLSMGLSCLQISAYNALDENGPTLSLPEIQAVLQQLYVEMNIKDSNGTRPCGKLGLSASVQCTRRDSRRGIAKRQYQLEVNSIQIHLFAETASTVVDVLNHLQDRMKNVDLSRERRYLHRLRQPTRRPSVNLGDSVYSEMSLTSSGILAAAFSVSLKDIELCWIIGNSVSPFQGHAANDLVLTIKMIDLRSRSQNSSRLTIEEFQLQMVPVSHEKQARSRNSALMPEVVFNISYASTNEDRKMTLQAKCKSLDLRLESIFILPANMLQRSIILAVNKFRDASALWEMTPTSSGAQRKNPFGDKRLSALLVDVDFAGAVITITDRKPEDRGKLAGRVGDAHFGRFGQFSSDGETAAATFRTPGIAMKGEYEDDGTDSSFTAEFKVSGSSNALTPTVVPLIMDMSNSVKLIVEASDKSAENKIPVKQEKQENTLAQSIFSDERLLNADPSAILGKTKFNLGIRICRQEFSLGCQPIARVDAAVVLDDIYITANSVKAPDQDLFFAVSASFEKLQASVQHVYSRESTFSFNMERLVLSVMNSKHLSGKAGISAVLKIFPMKTHINARQLQDFLLFRDIWIPKEIRQSSGSTHTMAEQQEYLVQRYQQVATATAFPWTASISIQSIEVDLDMGQAIGKASLQISDLWASSKKNSNWEQNLCLGIEKVAIESTGRTSGFVELIDVQVRTSISWPLDDTSSYKTPLIQASAGFDRLRVKAAFDYEAFGIMDIADFAFVMYNIRESGAEPRDRLVAILDGDMVQACCTAQSAAQGFALFQAVEKLIQENQAAYSSSLKDIERYLMRQSVVPVPRQDLTTTVANTKALNVDETEDAPVFLHTDVVVTLRAINLGAFPSSFSDNTVFLIEAKDIQGRFAVKMDDNLIHSGLGMTLGKVQVALTSTPHTSAPKTLQEITVEDVVETMVGARGGIILRVPKVVARMQTWQSPGTYHIDYIFRSSFEGKVDVGWNYARVAFIRDMYNSHTQSLASRLGRALPESALKITTGLDQSPKLDDSPTKPTAEDTKAEKITAVVNVPQSRYGYRALEPPVIETPQLRDMGEATPPLEWIGLHRDRLPNVTHQILIVGLLGIARNVEDAYERILGGSEKK